MEHLFSAQLARVGASDTIELVDATVDRLGELRAPVRVVSFLAYDDRNERLVAMLAAAGARATVAVESASLELVCHAFVADGYTLVVLGANKPFDRASERAEIAAAALLLSVGHHGFFVSLQDAMLSNRVADTVRAARTVALRAPVSRALHVSTTKPDPLRAVLAAGDNVRWQAFVQAFDRVVVHGREWPIELVLASAAVEAAAMAPMSGEDIAAAARRVLAAPAVNELQTGVDEGPAHARLAQLGAMLARQFVVRLAQECDRERSADELRAFRVQGAADPLITDAMRQFAQWAESQRLTHTRAYAHNAEVLSKSVTSAAWLASRLLESAESSPLDDVLALADRIAADATATAQLQTSMRVLASDIAQLRRFDAEFVELAKRVVGEVAQLREQCEQVATQLRKAARRAIWMSVALVAGLVVSGAAAWAGMNALLGASTAAGSMSTAATVGAVSKVVGFAGSLASVCGEDKIARVLVGVAGLGSIVGSLSSATGTAVEKVATAVGGSAQIAHAAAPGSQLAQSLGALAAIASGVNVLARPVPSTWKLVDVLARTGASVGIAGGATALAGEHTITQVLQQSCRLIASAGKVVDESPLSCAQQVAALEMASASFALSGQADVSIVLGAIASAMRDFVEAGQIVDSMREPVAKPAVRKSPALTAEQQKQAERQTFFAAKMAYECINGSSVPGATSKERMEYILRSDQALRELGPGWRVESSNQDAVLLVNDAAQRAILAGRGTDATNAFFRDVVCNWGAALGLGGRRNDTVCDEFLPLVQVLQGRGFEVVCTGHSLGAYAVSTVANRAGCHFFSYNGLEAPLSPNQAALRQAEDDAGRGHYYRIDGDLVSAVDGQAILDGLSVVGLVLAILVTPAVAVLAATGIAVASKPLSSRPFDERGSADVPPVIFPVLPGAAAHDLDNFSQLGQDLPAATAAPCKRKAHGV